VNDGSTDDSLTKLKQAIKSENLKVIETPTEKSFQAHKKRAVNYGIENSKGEIIVTTDTDCIHKENWLQNMVCYFDEETGFVSGPVDFINDNKLFTKLQKLEFAGLILSGAGLIGNNTPAICNGANLAYRRNVYEQVNGFLDNLNLSSGDDEILMQKIFSDTNYKIKFCINKDAMSLTKSNQTLTQFFQQRQRWASKGLFYKNKILVAKLFFIFLFYLGIITQFVFGFFSNIYFLTLVISFTIKLLIEYFILKKGTKILYNKEILKPFLLAEIFHIPYIIISGIAGALGNYKWKDRKVKR
jgi:cellulose synthase/poly-beta-1,6-N-acetylglucosamine synthase-like glycosyltransferase